jgi:hypothetical protein
LSLPSDIESYLTPDEKIIKTGKSQEWEIYITDRRVLFKKGGLFGKEIVEASYRHISSIEYKKESPWEGIIIGIVLIVLAAIIRLFLNDFFLSIFQYDIFALLVTIILGMVGIAVIVASFFIKPQFKIHVVGREPIPISGELEEIIKIIRQYREKVEAEITKRD